MTALVHSCLHQLCSTLIFNIQRYLPNCGIFSHSSRRTSVFKFVLSFRMAPPRTLKTTRLQFETTFPPGLRMAHICHHTPSDPLPLIPKMSLPWVGSSNSH